MALHFDEGEDFALHKPAGLPCPNLDNTLTCTIFDHLEESGFSGCARYDCRGAGQRVTQEVFAGKNWLDTPKLAVPMTRAFAAMRAVHEGLELLVAAQRIDLPEELELELDDLIEAYAPEDGWDEDSLQNFLASDAQTRLKAFLPRLRDLV